jgi:uncharacterized protein GlcG (DUF336 family)
MLGQMGAKRTQWEGVMRFPLTAMVALLIAASGAHAEPLPTQRFLPTSVAIEAALAAFDHCVRAGHHVSVEVMNHNAMILVTLHHELATIHSSYSAHAKAYTVLSYSFASGETTSGEIARRLTKNPADVARIQGIPGLILAPGGMLIQFGKQTVGAIGVGGSSGPVNDELCAKAGIEKIKDRLEP